MIAFSVSRIAASISAGHLRLSDFSSCSAIALARCFGFMSITNFCGSQMIPTFAPSFLERPRQQAKALLAGLRFKN